MMKANKLLYEETGKRLRNLMRDKNIKAVELSELSGVSKSNISQYINAYHAPNNRTAYKMALILGCSPEYLMGLDLEILPEDDYYVEKKRDQDLYEETSKRLRSLLSEKNMKAIELAEKTGINRSNISQYVNGVHIPSMSIAFKMAEVLNCNPAYLLGLDVDQDSIMPAQKLYDAFCKAPKHIQDAIMILLNAENEN